MKWLPYAFVLLCIAACTNDYGAFKYPRVRGDAGLDAEESPDSRASDAGADAPDE